MWTVCTGFQWCYVSSNAGNLRLPDEMSAHKSSENWDVKMEHLQNVVTHQLLYYKAKWWALSELRWPRTVSGQYEMRGGLVTEQLRLSVMRQVVTLLQLSHCTSCSNNQHCLTLQTYFCTSVNTILLKCLTIIIAVTDGYTCFLSERSECLYSIRLLCAEGDEDWGRTEGFVVPSARFGQQ